MTDVRTLLEDDELFAGSAVISHGYAPHLRDYDIIIDVSASLPSSAPTRGVGTYILGRYRYRFAHCPECHVVTEVSDHVWRESWEDVFVNYDVWEAAGRPEGFVWGVNYAEAYPGLRYIAESELAASWTRRMGTEMHEVAVETNAFVLRLVAANLVVDQLAVGDPLSGALTPVGPS